MDSDPPTILTAQNRLITSEPLQDPVNASRLSTLEREIPVVVSPNSRLSESNPASKLSREAIERVCRLFENIFASSLVLPRAKLDFSSLAEVANAFDSDCRRLKRMRCEWEKLLRSLVRVETSVERTGMVDTGLEASANAWSSEIFSHLTWPEVVTSRITLNLSDTNLQQSTQNLIDRVSSTAKSISASMAEHLGILQNQAVCGGIEWTARNECQFTYCTREINSSQNSSMMNSRRVSSKRELVLDSERNTLFKAEELITEVWMQTIPGTRRRLLTVHIHDLADAVKSHPLNVTVKIPADQQAILDSVPSWLMGQIEIVEGKLVRERQWCKEIGLENWIETRPFVSQWTELIPFDPAIVLDGTFVLSGWKLEEPVSIPPANGLSTLVKRVGELLS